MDVNEIRLQKTRELARRLSKDGGSGFKEIAEKMGWQQSLTSQLLGANAKRKITDQRAREIEKAFGKEHGWLDHLEPAAHDSVDNEALLLACMRAVRDEIRRLNLNLTPDDADELLVKSTIILYRFSQQAGDLLPASIAIASARL